MAAKPESKSAIEDVVLGSIHVSTQGQRELRQYRVDKLLADFDPNRLGTPVLNLRDGRHYCMDGQHRVAALKVWLGEGWEKQKVTCEVFKGLTEAEEAETFLRLNDTLRVGASDKFHKAVVAERPDESHVKRVVEKQGLHISTSKKAGGISAVTTLLKVYRSAGPEALGRALRIVRDAYGDAGMEARVIDGIGLLCKRYNGSLDEQQAKDRLANARGGVKGLTGKAQEYHLKTGGLMAHCIAAAAVDIINSGRGGTKLPNWWKA